MAQSAIHVLLAEVLQRNVACSIFKETLMQK